MLLSKIRSRFVTLAVFTLLTGFALGTPGVVHAAKWYVDNSLGEVKPEEKVAPVNPKPVQLLFEFQRDGASNPKATTFTQPIAMDALKATGDFSEIVTTPTADGAVLSITFNNVVKQEEIDKAKHDGFRAGLGFGLFGGIVATDNYVITLTYISQTGATPITHVVRHSLHMKYGKKDVEIPGTEVKNADEAVKIVIRQALQRGVNDIVADSAFPGRE